MLDPRQFVTVTDHVVVIADRDLMGGIMVRSATPLGVCLSRGAVVAYRSLFFGGQEAAEQEAAQQTIFAAAQESFQALDALAGGQGAAPEEPAGTGEAADATRVVVFADQLVQFVERSGALELTRTRPRVGETTEEVLDAPTEISLGARTVPLDAGRLRQRVVAGHTVGYHVSTFEFPTGSLTPDTNIVFTGGQAGRNPFATDERLGGCTTCGICGACAACTLCAEINFAVAAEYLVAVDFAIHLMAT